MKILFTGGGSGGHIYPIVAVARELIKISINWRLELYYLGPKDVFCDVVLRRERVKISHIITGKIRRYWHPLAFLQNIIDVTVKIPIGFIQALFSLMFINPDLIFSKGGYGSFPVTLAANLLGIPVFLQESDITPGMTGRGVAKHALEVFVSFPKTEFFNPKKMIVAGNPIRAELISGSKEEAKKVFSLQGNKPIILILGGSQGSQRINDKILNILPDLLNDFEIIHQTGSKNFEQTRREAQVMIKKEAAVYYHPVGFFDQSSLAHAYAAADIIVSRAGGGSIFEIAAAGKPSILIPLPEAAQNHQVKNAYAYAQSGAAIVIEENNFTAHLFLTKIHEMLATPATMQIMTQAAGAFARPKAAGVIAAYIVNYLTK